MHTDLDRDLSVVKFRHCELLTLSDELIQVHLVKVSVDLDVSSSNNSLDTFLHMDTCDELIQVNLVKVSRIQGILPLNISPDTFCTWILVTSSSR